MFAAPACSPAGVDRRAGVEYVIDGDTVILDDRTHVRLIGLDTPEIGHHGAPSEPFAQTARRFLVSLLNGAAAVELAFDAERHDTHGRLLAHVFLDGASVEARILEAGLAVPLTIPPDLGYLDCYRLAAAEAESARRGIWSLPQYQPVPAQRLAPDTHGYRIVEGRLAHVGHSRASVWLDFAGGFAVRIARTDLRYFPDPDFEALLGRRLQARGLVYRRSGQWRMRIRHPVDLSTQAENR